MKKVLVLFIALMLFSAVVSANDASMGRNGETVYPLEETDVRMVAEDIYIKFNIQDKSVVTCEFIFENSGDAKTVLMGFPAEKKLHEESLSSVENVRLHDFTAFRNGVEIEVNEVPGADMGDEFSDYPSWYVFEVPFEAGETLTMTHEYNIAFTSYSTGHIDVGYILKTGSTWNGTIGHTKVTFDFTAMNPWGLIMYNYPDLKSFTYKNGLLVFEKSDYTPDFNLSVMAYWPAVDNYPGTIWPESAEHFVEASEFYEKSKTASADELIEAYNSLSYDEKFIETVYLNTIMGFIEEPYAPVCTKMEKFGSRGFLFHVKDRNMDMEDNAKITINGNYNNVIYTGELYKRNEFGDYGTKLYTFHANTENVREAMANNLISSYVITLVDENGNSSETVFAADDFDNNRTTIKSGIKDDGSEGYVIVNPPTNVPMDHLLLGLLFSLICIGLFQYKRKVMDGTIQH